MKKMLAFFSWVPGKVAAGRKGGIQTLCLPRLAPRPSRKPRFYPARRLPANPAFIPLGAHQILNLVRKEPLPPLAGEGGRRPEGGNTNLVFIPLGGCSRGQCSPRLARTQSRIVHGKIPSPACGGRWPKAGRGEYKPCVYPVWRPALPANPAFIPLGDPLSLFRIRRGSRWRCRRFCRPRRRSLPR